MCKVESINHLRGVQGDVVAAEEHDLGIGVVVVKDLVVGAGFVVAVKVLDRLPVHGDGVVYVIAVYGYVE